MLTFDSLTIDKNVIYFLTYILEINGSSRINVSWAWATALHYSCFFVTFLRYLVSGKSHCNEWNIRVSVPTIKSRWTRSRRISRECGIRSGCRIHGITRARIGARDRKSRRRPRRGRAPRYSLRPVRFKRNACPALCLPSNRCRLKLREGKWPPRSTSPNSPRNR